VSAPGGAPLAVALADPLPAHAVAVVSGGLDSTTLAYWLHERSVRLTLLSFDYGQRHRKELVFARATADRLGVRHQLADLGTLGPLLAGSALTDNAVEVPDGHYTDHTMRATVVPNRNAIMLDVAVAIAVSLGADAVAYGAHAGDHAVYPDCRPEFLAAFRRLAAVANAGCLPAGFQVLAPFLGATKAAVVRLAADIGVPFAHTWSCYRGGEQHCGTCGACTERREAFTLAKVDDPTCYAPRLEVQ
jgi:7-cyano-7-deazaguanine synthase